MLPLLWKNMTLVIGPVILFDRLCITDRLPPSWIQYIASRVGPFFLSLFLSFFLFFLNLIYYRTITIHLDYLLSFSQSVFPLCNICHKSIDFKVKANGVRCNQQPVSFKSAAGNLIMPTTIFFLESPRELIANIHDFITYRRRVLNLIRRIKLV